MADAKCTERLEDKGSVRAEWTLTASEPKGEWWKSSGKSDKTFHIFNVLDGATVKFKGSSDERCITDPDNAVSVDLKNSGGSPVSVSNLTDGKNMDTFFANPAYIRPELENPGANTVVKVVVTGTYIQ